MGIREIVPSQIRLRRWFDDHLEEIYRGWLLSRDAAEGVGWVEFDGEFHWNSGRNLASNSRYFFELRSSIFWEAENRGRQVVAVIHQHRTGSPALSERDMDGAVFVDGDGRKSALFPGVFLGVICPGKDGELRGELFGFDENLQEFVALSSARRAGQSEGTFS